MTAETTPRVGGAQLTAEHRALLRAGLLRGEQGRAAIEAWFAVSEVDVLDDISYRLLPLLYRNVDRLGVSHPSVARLKGIWRHSWYSNQRLFHRVAPGLDVLRAAGIPICVIKGAALVASRLADMGERPMEDVDVLVPQARVHEAHHLLVANGWRWEDDQSLADVMRVKHSHPMHGPDGAQIDLHWRPLWEPASTGEMWSRMTEGLIGGVPVSVPSVADQIVVTCAHGVGWYPSPLRWVPDTAMLGRSADAALWDEVVAAAIERRMAAATAASLRVVAEVAGLDVPVDVLGRLDAARVSLVERAAVAQKLRGGGTASRYTRSFEYAVRSRHDPDGHRAGLLEEFRASQHVSSAGGLVSELARGARRAATRIVTGRGRG